MPHATAADGTPIWYDTLGAGPDPAAVLVSGQSLDHRMWDGVAERLARRRRVVLVDNRGTGRSRSLGATPLTTDVFADDLVAVLDRLAGERAHVVGFSMGGRVAQALAVRHPERVASLVLVATGPGAGHEVARPQAANQALLGAQTDAGREAMVGYFFSPAFVAAHPDLPAKILPSSTPESMRAHFEASRSHGVWDALPSIGAPTLVVHGAEDELTPAGNGELLAARIPGARLVVLPGRHGVLHENPDALAAVESFLDEVDAAGDGGPSWVLRGPGPAHR